MKKNRYTEEQIAYALNQVWISGFYVRLKLAFMDIIQTSRIA